MLRQADDESTENTIVFMPLLLDLASHISGGLAVLKRLSQRLAKLCGLLENSTEVGEGILEGLHSDNLPELFVLFNAVIKSITGQLDWVFSKIGEFVVGHQRIGTTHALPVPCRRSWKWKRMAPSAM